MVCDGNGNCIDCIVWSYGFVAFTVLVFFLSGKSQPG